MLSRWNAYPSFVEIIKLRKDNLLLTNKSKKLIKIAFAGDFRIGCIQSMVGTELSDSFYNEVYRVVPLLAIFRFFFGRVLLLAVYKNP